MTTTNNQEILDKIAKLKAHAQSAKEMGSVEEANVFYAKLQELLDKYNLTLEDLDAHTVYDGLGSRQIRIYTGEGYLWKLELIAHIIDQSQGFSVVHRRKYVPHRATVIAQEPIIDSLLYIYNNLSTVYMRKCAEAMAEEVSLMALHGSQLRKARKEFKKSFYWGAVFGYSEKIKTQKQESDDSQALVLLKTQAEQKAHDMFDNLGESESKDLKITDYKAFFLGKEVGESTEVQKAIEKSRSKQLSK